MMLYVSLVLMTLLGAVASLLLKKACVNLNVRYIYRNGWFFGGGGLYFVTALMNIALLRYLDYSVVLPFTSLTIPALGSLITVLLGRVFIIPTEPTAKKQT